MPQVKKKKRIFLCHTHQNNCYCQSGSNLYFRLIMLFNGFNVEKNVEKNKKIKFKIANDRGR